MIQVKGRMLCVPDGEQSIGHVADNRVEVRQFLITDAAFFDFTFELDLENGMYTDVVTLEKEMVEGGVLLTWKITAANLQYPGILRAQLRAFSEEGEVWHSQVVSFPVSESIYAPGAFPPIPPSAYETFKNSLQALLRKTASIECGEGADALALVGALRAMAEGCVAIGPGSIAGRKAYYIKSIDLAAKKIYLSAEQVIPPQMSIADNTDADFETPAYDVGDAFSIIAGSHYCFCAKIAAIQNNVITYDGDLGFTSFDADAAFDAYTLSVPSKPEVGAVILGAFGFVAGENCKANGRGFFGGGRDNIGSNYATMGGCGNTAGYAVGVDGYGNYVPGIGSHGGGYWNEIFARYCLFGGTRNRIEKNADCSDVGGEGNNIGTPFTLGGGLNNKSKNGRVNTFHGENLDIEGSFNDVEGRGHRVWGDFNFVRGEYLIASGEQAVFGAYNKEDADKLLIIGGGTQEMRKNILTIDREGNINGVELKAMQKEIISNRAKLDSMQKEVEALGSMCEMLSKAVRGQYNEMADFTMREVMEGLTEEIRIAPRFSFFGSFYRILVDGAPLEEMYMPIGEAFRTAHGALVVDSIKIELYDGEKQATCRCRLQVEHEEAGVLYGILVKE